MSQPCPCIGLHRVTAFDVLAALPLGTFQDIAGEIGAVFEATLAHSSPSIIREAALRAGTPPDILELGIAALLIDCPSMSQFLERC